MKPKTQFFVALFLCLTTISSHAQAGQDSIKTNEEIIDSGEDENKIFTMVEVEAAFPGGNNGWRTYLQTNLDPEVPIRKRAKRGRYQVVIRFIVNKEGVISNVSAETSFGHGMEEEAMRVIKNGPKWMPAFQNGKAVNAYRRQPITFVIE